MRRVDETADPDFDRLWMAYACGGGQLLIDDFRDALVGDRPLSDLEHRILASAIDDWYPAVPPVASPGPSITRR